MKKTFKYYFIEEPTDLEVISKNFEGLPITIEIYTTPRYNFNLERYTFGVLNSTYLLSIEDQARYYMAPDPRNFLFASWRVKG